MPYTGIVLTFVAVHAAALLILLGYWVASAGMFPQATRAFADVYDRRPLRATLVGIFTYGVIFVLFLQNAKIHNGPIRAGLFILTFATLLIALIGSAGLALRIGRNLGSSAEPWQQVLRGSVMLALVFITPLLGSLFLLHIGLASGFGAFLLARPWKSNAATEPAMESVTAPPQVPTAPPAPAAPPIPSFS
jgi:hypothetical protein